MDSMGKFRDGAPLGGGPAYGGQGADKPAPAFPVVREGRIWLPSLGLRRSERQWLLLLADLFLLAVALVVTVWLRTDMLDAPGAIWANWKWFVTLALVWVGAATIFDCYNLARAASTTHSVAAIAGASVLATVAYQATPWLTPAVQSRTQFFLFVALATGSLMGWRYVYARFFVQPTFQRRALIVGAGSSGRALVEALQSEYARQDANPFRGTGHIFLGFVDDKPEYAGVQVAGLPVLGGSAHLVSLARRLAVDEVVVAITHKQSIQPALFEAILDCREMGLPVTTMTTIYERLTERVAVEHASRDIEIATGHADGLFMRFYGVIKRVMDVLGALVGLLVVGLLWPLVWLGNRLSSPGPILYRQERVGRGGRMFKVYKFRSMWPDAEENGAVWATKDDQRVTPIGRILRKTHLDELPQVYNVLKGEMSLVGPRPERPEFVQQLSREIPFYRARHCVKPGITGWAQIHQDYGDSVERAKEKLEYDLFYVKRANPLLDALIILRTVSKILGLKGR